MLPEPDPSNSHIRILCGLELTKEEAVTLSEPTDTPFTYKVIFPFDKSNMAHRKYHVPVDIVLVPVTF